MQIKLNKYQRKALNKINTYLEPGNLFLVKVYNKLLNKEDLSKDEIIIFLKELNAVIDKTTFKELDAVTLIYLNDIAEKLNIAVMNYHLGGL